jgi:hypothetical protein
VNGQPSLATNHGDQAKNNVKDAAGQGSDQRDRVVSLNLAVSKKAANLAVPREREPESQAECNKKNRTYYALATSNFLPSVLKGRGPRSSRSKPIIRSHTFSRRVIIIAGVNDCLGRDILSVRQMALRAAVLYPSTPLREQRGPVMPVTEDTPRQLVLKSGSTT